METWRRSAGRLMADWGASAEAVELVRLGVTELLTNVSRHVADPRCCLRISRGGGDVLVEVCDRSARPPVIGETPDWTSECGRGLWLLREMADDLGYMPMPYASPAGPLMGKSVWFTCRSAFSGAGVG